MWISLCIPDFMNFLKQNSQKENFYTLDQKLINKGIIKILDELERNKHYQK